MAEITGFLSLTRDLATAAGSWLWYIPVLITVGLWGMNQKMGAYPLSQINNFLNRPMTSSNKLQYRKQGNSQNITYKYIYLCIYVNTYIHTHTH